MERVAGVDEGLVGVSGWIWRGETGGGYHEKGPGAVVKKDGGGYDEHGEADELVELSKTLAGKMVGNETEHTIVAGSL